MPTRKNAHRGKCPQGKMLTGKYAHKGKMPTGKNAHREKFPPGKIPTGKNAPQGIILTCITVLKLSLASAFVKNRAMWKGILRSQKILVDFEKANMNAVLLAFPEAEIKGCYFHLCQNLVMMIQSVGLKSEFECNM